MSHLKAYSLFLKAATLGDAKALSALSSMHHIGYIFPPYKSDAIRFALLAQNNGWDYDNDYFNYTVVNEVSKKKLKKLMEQVKSCSKPFDQRCKISEPLELTGVYLRKSDIKFMKYKKGLLFDGSRKFPLEKMFNHYLRMPIPLPMIFSKTHTKIFINKNRPNVCQVEGDVMKLVWYSNSDMPDGKSLEFQDDDFIEFDCEEVNF